MITYVANYEKPNKPYICKVFTASNGEEFHTALNYANEEERKSFSAELIYEHLDNVLKYIRDESESLSMIALEEPVGLNPWPIKGWEKLEWANTEANLWWNEIYYRPESPVNNNLHVTSSMHDDSDHTHDPETGEEIPNA